MLPSAAARAAFPAWRATPATERAARLLELVEALGRRQEELARLDAADNGSPVRDMRIDVAIGMAELRYFAGLALQLRGETIPVAHGRLNYTLREPFGVVARIVPFNHPILFAAMKIGAPLVAGNTVVLKPSEQTSLSTLVLAQELARIFPPGVVNVVTGYGAEAGDALVAHPDVPRARVHRPGRDGPRDPGAGRRRGRQDGDARVRRQEPDRRLPGRRSRRGARGRRARHELQLPGPVVRLDLAADRARGHPRELRRARSRSASTALRVGPAGATTRRRSARSSAEAQLDKVARYVELGKDEGATLVTGGTRPDDARARERLLHPPGAVRRRRSAHAARAGGDLRAGARGHAVP